MALFTFSILLIIFCLVQGDNYYVDTDAILIHLENVTFGNLMAILFGFLLPRWFLIDALKSYEIKFWLILEFFCYWSVAWNSEALSLLIKY